MDPNATLEEIRSLIIARRHRRPVPDHDQERFYELVEELDRWLCRGGFKPVAWNVEEGYINPVAGKLEKLEELGDLYDYLKADAEHAEKLRNVLAAHPNAEGLVIYECLQMDSSELGRRTTMVVGPGCEGAESIEKASQGHLYDLPSQRQYPRAYYKVYKANR
jgi:hypothetical protein